jgi:hemerythrin-like domain-containing protein
MMLRMKITEALVAEHTTFLTVFHHIERVLPSLATQTEIGTMANIVEGLLESHAKTETNMAYLALDHVLEQNGELKRMHQDHREIDDRLREVHRASTCSEARRLLKAVLAGCREHFQLEERNVFPLMEKVLKEETLIKLGQGWLQRSTARA